MTTDQDFSVAASDASAPNAPDSASQDAPKPKRRTSSRRSSKTPSDAVTTRESAEVGNSSADAAEVASQRPKTSKSRGNRARAAATPEENTAEPAPAARPRRSTARNAQRPKTAAKTDKETTPAAMPLPPPEQTPEGDTQQISPPLAPDGKAKPTAPKRARASAARGARGSRSKQSKNGQSAPPEAAALQEVESGTVESRLSEALLAPVENAPSAHDAPPSKAVTADDESAATPDEAASIDASEASAATDENVESPRRKSRRGRRGGRGRSRKTRPADADEAAADAVSEAVAHSAEDDADMTAEEAARPDDGAQTAQARAKATKSRETRSVDDESETNATARAATARTKADAAPGKRRMFISVLPGEQVEVALAEEGQVLEYYLDMLHQRKIKGNIYKGVIHNIDTNLQAAFVSYGSGKNGFLQIDEIHPEYWLAHHEPAKGKKFPPIQKVLKAGQEVLVQVVKEPTGNKGAFLTTWISLAGRFLVLTPGQEQIGVSRKVDNDEERGRLRELMTGIDPGQGLGVIVRTVSAGTPKTTLKNDLQYLKRLWRDIRKKATEVSAPALVYQEPGLSERAVRDYLTDDVCEIWVDNEEVAQSIRDTVSLLFPRKKDLVRLHDDVRQPMWERFSLRRQLDQIYSREVLLPSGGRLVFDQTEALMAIDINSGKISGKGNFEAMAHKTNMEAAETIARHLKLRDVGGQVVIDFIEMREKKHVLEVEKTLRAAMKNDRARHDVGRMSSFGLLELVRQRTGSSALAITMEPCPACGGTGQRRNLEWQALQALRELRRTLRAGSNQKCVFQTSPELGLYLLNHKRDSLREMEQDYGKCLEIAIRA